MLQRVISKKMYILHYYVFGGYHMCDICLRLTSDELRNILQMFSELSSYRLASLRLLYDCPIIIRQ